MGGALGAIERGFPQEEISRSAYEYQMAIEQEKQVIVGVNRFTQEDENAPVSPSFDPEVERKQVARVKAFKVDREQQVVQQTLHHLKEAAETDANLMPYIIEAVRHRATLGEICDTLRGIFGEYERTERF